MNKRILIRWLITTWLSPTAVLCGIVGWAAWQIGATVSENRANFAYIAKSSKTGVDDVFAETRDVTIAVLKPCKKDHPETCGLIPAVRQTVQDTGSAVKVMQQQVAQTQPLIVAAAKTLGQAGDAIQDSAGHINKTADAGADTFRAASLTLDAGTTTLNTLNTKVGPLMDAYTNTGTDMHKILVENSTLFHASLTNFTDMTGSGKSILADSALEIHNWTHPNKKRLTFWTATEAGGDYVKHFMPSIF